MRLLCLMNMRTWGLDKAVGMIKIWSSEVVCHSISGHPLFEAIDHIHTIYSSGEPPPPKLKWYTETQKTEVRNISVIEKTIFRFLPWGLAYCKTVPVHSEGCSIESCGAHMNLRHFLYPVRWRGARCRFCSSFRISCGWLFSWRRFEEETRTVTSESTVVGLL